MTFILPVKESDGMAMQEKCATCAFRSGSQASLSPLTIMQAQLCAEIPEMFLCHEAHAAGDEVACAGWTSALFMEQQANFILSNNLVALSRENAELRRLLAHRRNFRAWAFLSIPVIGLLGLALILKMAFEG